MNMCGHVYKLFYIEITNYLDLYKTLKYKENLIEHCYYKVGAGDENLLAIFDLELNRNNIFIDWATDSNIYYRLTKQGIDQFRILLL